METNESHKNSISNRGPYEGFREGNTQEKHQVYPRNYLMILYFIILLYTTQGTF